MAMSTGACWGGHFCVEPGIFVSNRAFLCRTMHFAVELGFFVSNKCYNTDITHSEFNHMFNKYVRIKMWKKVRDTHFHHWCCCIKNRCFFRNIACTFAIHMKTNSGVCLKTRNKQFYIDARGTLAVGILGCGDLGNSSIFKWHWFFTPSHITDPFNITQNVRMILYICMALVQLCSLSNCLILHVYSKEFGFGFASNTDRLGSPLSQAQTTSLTTATYI